MIFFYKVKDLKNGKTYSHRTNIDEFGSYRDFIGYLEGQNQFWAGQLRFEEDREKIEEDSLTRELLVV